VLDGGPGGARGAPPAIDQGTAEVKASGATLSSTRTRTKWPQRVRLRASGTTDSFRVLLASSRTISRLAVELAPFRPSSRDEPTNRIPTGRVACRRHHQPSDRRVQDQRPGERPAQRSHHSNHEPDDEPGPGLTDPIDPSDRWGT
jgi:hypothetical protein